MTANAEISTLTHVDSDDSLPNSWTWAPVEYLAATNRYSLAIGPFGSNLKTSDYTSTGVPLVFVRNIRSGKFNDPKGVFVSPSKAEELHAHQVNAGDLLITKMGDPPGDAELYPLDQPPAVITADCIKFTVNQAIADPKFVLYAIRSPGVQAQIPAITQGVAQKKISLARFKSVRLPVPPLPEQRRIVAEIETQFTRLDAAVAALERALANLKRIRKVVLANSVRGKGLLCVHESLRVEQPLSDGELPPDWKWVRVHDAGKVQLGRQRSPQHHSGPNMRPYLRVANVYENRLDLSDVLEMNFTPTEFERYEILPGDILLNEGQSIEWVGRPAMFKGEIEGVCFQNTLVRFRAPESVDPRFALIVFRAYLHDGTFQRIARWTVNIAHLGAERFADLQFPLPPVAIQRKIVEEIESRLSLIDETESTIYANLKRAKRLREAVLRKAFTGQLVPQDPNDEPANALLERVRAERSASASMNKSKPKASGRTLNAPEVQRVLL